MGCTAGKQNLSNLQRRSSIESIQPDPIEGFTHCGPWIQEPSDLTDYPRTPDNYPSNQLLKILTPELWQKYASAQDQSGYSFKQAIFHGC